MWARVPVVFVRRSDKADTTNDEGIRITAKTSKAAMEGHSWFHLMGYIIPPNRPEIPSTIRSVTLMAGNITKLKSYQRPTEADYGRDGIGRH